MKSKIIFLLLILNSVLLPAQIRIDWQQCYGSFSMDHASRIAKKEGGYWVTGMVREQSGLVTIPAAYRSWVIDIDETGNLKMELGLGQYARHCEDFFANYNGVDYYAIGLPPNEFGKDQLGIKKINANGDVLWERLFGDKNKAFWDVTKGIGTPDGGALASTTTQWSGGDISNHYGWNDVWVVKVDSQGNLEWETTLGTENSEYPCSFSVASEGGYYVTMTGNPGYTGSIPVCQVPTIDDYDGLIAKLDVNGNLLWSRCYGGSKHESIKGVIELENGFLLTCYTQSDDRDAEGAGYHLGYLNNLPYNRQTKDIWLIRTDADGNIIWSRCYGGTGDETPTKAFQNEDGGFTVFGTTASIDGDAQSAQNLHWSWQEYVYSKLWVFRTDVNGNLMWERAIGTKMSRDMYLEDVVKLSDTEYTILGTAHPPAEGYEGDFSCTNWDNRLCGYDSYWVLHITDIFNYDDPTGIEEQPKVVPLQMNVHPNPATTWVAIDYTLPNGNAKAELSMFNAMGVKVKQVELDGNQGQKVLDLRGLAPGVYFYTLCCGGLRQTDKLVLVR